MKILESKILSGNVAVATTKEGFDKDNMFTGRQKEDLWKSDTLDPAVIMITAPAGSNCIFVSNTNSISGNYEIVGENISGKLDLVTSGYYSYYAQKRQTPFGQIWVDYPAQAGEHVIKLTLAPDTKTNPGTTDSVEVGILRAGIAHEFNSPVEFTKTFVDYSISKQNNDGSDYYKRRDIVRKIEGFTTLLKGTDVKKFTKLTMGSMVNPVAWNIIDNKAGEILFGEMTTPTKVTHKGPVEKTLTFSVLEVL